MTAFDCSDGSFVALCTRCKLYSSGGRVAGLSRRCPDLALPLSDHQMRGRRYSWNFILAGRHPKSQNVTLQFVDFLDDLQ